MNNELTKKIRKRLEKKLEPSRMEHTLGVAYTAASLAMLYNVDMEKAFLAGLLHDCAKHYSNQELIEKCNKYSIEISQSEYKQPDLLQLLTQFYKKVLPY